MGNDTKIEEGTVMVAVWGYSMILTTWVKVLKISPKTLLVQEIATRSLTTEELEEKGLKPGFLQNYVVPMAGTPLKGNSMGDGPRKDFRLYNRDGGKTWHGKPDTFSTTLYFEAWDGKPQFEDHCD